MKLPAFASLLAAIALAARYSSDPPRASDDTRVYRPPITHHFAPAPGYTAELRQARQSGEHDRFTLYRGGELVMNLERWPRTEVYNLPPYLVVKETQGEWRCNSHILRFRPEFSEVTALTSIRAEFQLDSQGQLLAYSCDSIGYKRFPSVILRLEGNQFRLAPSLLPRPLGAEQTRCLLAGAREQANFGRAIHLFDQALYSGHPELCRQALQISPASLAEKRQFLDDYRRRLRRSRWGAGLESELPQLKIAHHPSLRSRQSRSTPANDLVGQFLAQSGER